MLQITKNSFIKLSLSLVCVICILIANPFFAKADYQGKSEVSKDSTLETVYSLTTGTNIYECYYGGTCTSGTITLTPQYLYGGTYHDVTVAAKTINSGESFSSTVYNPPGTVWRLKISGLGKGSGYIQGK